MKCSGWLGLIGLVLLAGACNRNTTGLPVAATLAVPTASATTAVTTDAGATALWATVVAVASGLPGTQTAEAEASPTPDQPTEAPLTSTAVTPSPEPATPSASPSLTAAAPSPSPVLPTPTRAAPSATPRATATRGATPAGGASPTTAAPTASATASATPTSSARLLAFHAHTERINPGDAVTLEWAVQGTRAELCAMEPHGVLLPNGCQTVPLSGTTTLATAPTVRYWARFSLRAYDDQAGGFAPYAELAIPVNCPDGWFTGGPPGGLGQWDCPAGPARVTTGAAERFEFGGMYWLAEPDEILVYWSGGQAHVADLPSDQPDSDPSLVPPPGYYQPVHGFGLAWRGLTALGDLRPLLGWAVEPEYEYTFTYQCNAAPDPRSEVCLVLGPHGLTTWLILGWGERLWP